MRTSTICAFVFAVLCLCVLPQQARAQYAYGTSAIGYDDNTKEVFGYSSTELDYYAGYYYDPYVEGFMYDQYNYNPISSGYNRGFAYYYPAEVGTYHWPGLPDTEYDVISDHYVIAAWSTSVQICDDYYYSGCWADYWYDAWGYGFLGGGDFGAPWWWWGNWYGGYVPERTYYLGSTGVYIITPSPQPSCNASMQLRSVTPHRETGDLSGQTRTAMLGAEVYLTADVTVNGSPVNGESGAGNWSWSAEGNYKMLASQVDRSKAVVIWNTEGSHTVSVTYSDGNGCQVTKSMQVNVTVPAVTQYTADLVPERLTTNSANCSETPGRDVFSLGCAHPDPATTEPGITFRATAKIPDDSISDPAKSRIKFVQIVNLYRHQVTASRGSECMTFRSSPGDIDSPSAWRIDTQDPYQREGEIRSGISSKGVNNFGEDLLSSIETRDSPSHSLSYPEQIYQFDLDDRFEMLVEYFNGSSNPDLSTPGTTQIIGTLAWSWGGHATYIPSSDSYSYSVAHPAGAHYTGVGTRQVRGFIGLPYNPRTDPNAFHECPGGDGGPFPTPTPIGGGCSGDNSQFVSQSVPTTMDAGVNYNVSVTMKNPCGSTWTSDVYKLGSQNPQDNLTWGTNRVYLPSGTNVGPGNTFTFNYMVTAPSTPGSYNFQWRMVHEAVQWFGEFTPNVVVNVVGSACDPSAEQDCYYNGGDWFDTSTCVCHYPPPPCRKCDLY